MAGYAARPRDPKAIQGRVKFGSAVVDVSRKRYCTRGHDTHSHGRTRTGHCYICKCEAGVARNHRMSKEDFKLMWVCSKYKITREKALEVLSIESCQMCGSKSTITGKSLHIDHCHETGEVRGVLCHFCNVGIGAFGHSGDRLKAAIQYLERNKA